MFFLVSKLFVFLTLLGNILIALALIGAVLLYTRFARAGRRLVVGSLVVFVILGISPAGNFLYWILEQRFAAWDPARGAPDGIIVLGGAIDVSRAAWRGRPIVNESFGRIIAAVELAEAYPPARIVYSGGSGSLTYPDVIEADLALPLLESLGIARQRIVLERKARNTAENAAFAKEAAQPKPGERWLLITSAAHMPRAIGAFRRVGFPVEAYPVDARIRNLQDLIAPSPQVLQGVAITDAALHEWVGLVVYWATGRSSELFPGPAVSKP
jgi:uncharacterized SAM-binding protein YcdF (DUF218 family)